MIRYSKHGSSATLGIVSIVAAATAIVLLGWLAVYLTVRLTGTFEVIAAILGWILWPFWI